MSALVWDASGSKTYEVGVSKGVLYPKTASPAQGATSLYDTGVVWNGLISVSENPEGAELNDLWADNIKYGGIRSAEDNKGSIEAYTYPDEFAACDGSAEPVTGLYIGQQARKAFGLCYRTELGDDSSDSPTGYKLHLIYNATVSPAEKSYETINDSPDAITFSWDYSTTPVNVTGHKPTSILTINSKKVDATKLAALEATLYGGESTSATLPSPDDVIAALTTTSNP